MADASTTPPTPWRRRIGTAPKSWVIAMAVGVCLAWLPFAGRSLSPDEAGYLIVGGQWAEGSSLYGDFWVDRPPVLIAIFEAADALGGAVPLRLIGDARGGPHGDPVRRARPDRRARAAVRSPAHRRYGGGVRRHAVVRRRRWSTASCWGCRSWSPGSWRTSRPRRAATRSGGSCSAWPRVRPGRSRRLVKQSMVDVFVVAAVLLFTSGAARRKLPGLLAGALVTVAVVVAAAWARGTVPADLWDAVVTFRVDAARELAGDSGNAPGRLVGLVGALAASGVPLVVAAFAWKGRGEPSSAGAVDRAGPAGGGVRPAHVRAARRLPGRQLLAALPDGAGARSRAVRRGVRAAAGAGDAEHRWLARAGRRAPRSAALGWVAAHPIDRPEEQAISYLDDHADRGDSAVVVLGAANVVRDARPRRVVPLPLEPARPGPRRRPGDPGRAARERPSGRSG